MRSAVRIAVLATCIAWVAAACEQAAPTVEGVGPSGSSRATQAPTEKPVELARPDPAPAQQPPAQAQAPAAAATVQTPPPVDLADLGPIQVMTWDDAQRQAEQRITPDTADAELAQLASELESGP